MFELGTIYGIFLIAGYATGIMGIAFILINKFFRKEYFANYIRYGISIFRLIFEAIMAGLAVYVVIIHHDRLSMNMIFIHLFGAFLLFADIVISVILKIYIEKKSKRVYKKEQ
ncbi:MAG: hypothetical protein LBM59_03115 [Ruminococcus sp.]|jgi:hypothetical protein|nr:hypothetical protein [Ruminococcus sp.]